MCEKSVARMGETLSLGPLPVPLLVGILPLESSRHAEFLHNEVPGVVVPAAVRDRLRAAGDRGADVGARLAAEFLGEVERRAAGTYLVSPSGQPDTVLSLLAGLTGKRRLSAPTESGSQRPRGT